MKPVIRIMSGSPMYFLNVFRATRSKTTPLPAALNQARGIDTMYFFISSQTCYMICILIDTIKYTLLHYEKIHRGMNNKQYLLMCGIFQCSNLPAVKVFLPICLYTSLCTLIGKPVNGIYVSGLYTTLFCPNHTFCVLLCLFCFFGIFEFYTMRRHSAVGVICYVCVPKGHVKPMIGCEIKKKGDGAESF
jgi:hypothetical protein